MSNSIKNGPIGDYLMREQLSAKVNNLTDENGKFVTEKKDPNTEKANAIEAKVVAGETRGKGETGLDQYNAVGKTGEGKAAADGKVDKTEFVNWATQLGLTEKQAGEIFDKNAGKDGIMDNKEFQAGTVKMRAILDKN